MSLSRPLLRRPPSVWVCGLWVVMSVFWLDVLVGRLHQERIAGRSVGANYAEIVLWVAILLVWIGLALRAWKDRRDR